MSGEARRLLALACCVIFACELKMFVSFYLRKGSASVLLRAIENKLEIPTLSFCRGTMESQNVSQLQLESLPLVV